MRDALPDVILYLAGDEGPLHGSSGCLDVEGTPVMVNLNTQADPRLCPRCVRGLPDWVRECVNVHHDLQQWHEAVWEDRGPINTLWQLGLLRHGVVHPQDRWCRGAVDTIPIHMGEMLLDPTLALCTQPVCTRLLGSKEVPLLGTTAQLHHDLSMAVAGGNLATLLLKVVRTTSVLSYHKPLALAYQHKNQTIKAQQTRLLTEVEDQAAKAQSLLRDPAIRARLETDILTDESNDSVERILKNARLGKSTDMGVLVGPERVRNQSILAEILLDILKEKKDHPGGNHLMVAPLGVLQWMARAGTAEEGYLGMERQVVEMPSDLTPEMKELILGLYEAGNEGPAGSLLMVVEAARGLLSDTKTLPSPALAPSVE